LNDLDKVATENLSSLELEILFPVKNRKLQANLALKTVTTTSHFGEIGETHVDSVNPENKPVGHATVSFQKVLEISIPFESLSCGNDDRLDFFLTIQPPGILGERWPLYGTFSAELPGIDYNERMWEV